MIPAGARFWRRGLLAQFAATYLGLSVSHRVEQPAVGMQAISLKEARKTLGEPIDRTRLAGEPTMITRYGKPGAVVVSAAWHHDAADCLEQSADGPRRDQKA